MQDFQLRNDTKLVFRNDPIQELCDIVKNKRVLFVYGSGSENGLGAVAADSKNDDFGTAYGIPADYAILSPKYSMALNSEMTAYTALVTLVQLSASTIQ